MKTVSITLALFVLLGLIVRKYDSRTRLMLSGIVIGVIAFLYLT